jgi:anthraniloyl-CoA monooxygenase
VNVLTLGGGPAGLYASLLLKKAHPDLAVTVLERNPAGATYGWGVVFSDRTLAEFREADLQTYEAITDRFVLWDAIDIRYRDELIRSGGHVFAGMSRRELLRILQERCRELGVQLRFEVEVQDLSRSAEYDLVIAADGVNSLARRAFEAELGTRLEEGRARYIWFGTTRVLDSFTFIFRENEHGFFQTHAYPFDGETATWIVECHEDVWRAAGLDTASEHDSIAYCEKLFAEDLRGHRLMSNRSTWIPFVTVRNRTWRRGNVVLLGDAAHTAHFSIGSGTKLAMEDAISLARSVERRPGDLEAALTDYELERRPVVERFQEAAEESRAYFETTSRYRHLEPMQFAFHLLTRSGRIDYDVLRLRDTSYVEDVDRWFAGGLSVAAAPALAPLSLPGLEVRNRVVASPAFPDDADDGALGDEQLAGLKAVAGSGAGLILADLVAISAHGRVGLGSPGLYVDDHLERWGTLVDEAHRAGSAVGVRIGHAGRRGATRPRREGLDRPLQLGAWPLLAPSRIPYTPRSPAPEDAMERRDEVLEDFVAAARRAAEAGVDLLLVDMSRGYLLGSFLSPLTNQRSDEFGGALEGRMRYPLEVFEALRAAWPEDRPLGVTLKADDWERRGLTAEDGVEIARALGNRGCDLIEPRAGQTTPRSRPRYGRGFLVPYADRIKNEAGVATIAGGGITTMNQVNTIVAGARADLCVVSYDGRATR